MTTTTATALRRAAFLLLLVPTGACAQPVDPAPTTSRDAAAAARGITLATFLKRQQKKLLAGDTDGDGKIAKAEFLAAATGKGDPARHFARIDRNSDAMLDTGEIDVMLTRRFNRLDANGDGMVAADERAARAKARRAGDGAKP